MAEADLLPVMPCSPVSQFLSISNQLDRESSCMQAEMRDRLHSTYLNPRLIRIFSPEPECYDKCNSSKISLGTTMRRCNKGKDQAVPARDFTIVKHGKFQHDECTSYSCRPEENFILGVHFMFPAKGRDHVRHGARWRMQLHALTFKRGMCE